MAAETKLTAIITAKDQASKTFRMVASSADKLKFGIAALGAAAGAAAIAIGVKAVKAAVAFEKGMSNVSTLIDTTTENMKEMGDQVKEIATRTPVALEDLTAALFDVRSAGISASQAMDVLETSAKLGVAGLGSTKEAADLLTSALNTFSEQGLTANETADILFKTTKAGKTTISELSRSFGATAPVIAAAGIKLQDFQAATAALTTTGLPASQAQMGLRQAIVSLIKPSAEMQEVFKALGITDVPRMIKESEGLGNIFGMLRNASEDQNLQWAKALGSVEALNAVTGILDTTNQAYVATTDEMVKGTNALDEAFAKQKETTSAQYQLFKNKLNVVLIKIGDAILPTLIEAMSSLGAWFDRNEDKIEDFVAVLEEVAAAALVVGKVIGKVFGTIGKAGSFAINKVFDILGFQEGGIVPGPVGAPQLAVVHGGEQVIPVGETASNITINLNNPVVRDEQDINMLVEQITEALGRRKELKQLGGL